MGIFSQKVPATSITANIERATAPDQQGLDWELLIQICNVVNTTELGAKEARKLLQKKLVQGETNTKILALSMLEALFENCGPKFHAQLVAKSFIEALNTIAFSPNTDPKVHGKLIAVLQAWTTQFQSNRDLMAIPQLYASIMEQGSSWTLTGAGANSARTNSIRRSTSGGSGGNGQHPGQRGREYAVYPPDGFQPIPQELSMEEAHMRLTSDIEVAKNNAQILSQTLSFTDPEKEDISKNELIQEFYGKSKLIQQTIQRYLEDATDPDLLATLLETNQELLNVFKTYDDMLEHKALAHATKVSEKVNYRGTGGPPLNTQSALIDFDEPSTSGEGSSKQPVNGNGSLPVPLVSSQGGSTKLPEDDNLLL
ncbi:hypothetical protein BC936DRAFT_146058 [Jimgerdemannia flammicorona]|uniref:VHS domain-containing protein n=1 Tax=Jimgerdemannia flammicorona TaxID=994334 RepID=A0A433D8H0_9FUNG|nr:hypothetical protein BC936DRAFT_146058 [Jimgerdemannia flammicorona]